MTSVFSGQLFVVCLVVLPREVVNAVGGRLGQCRVGGGCGGAGSGRWPRAGAGCVGVGVGPLAG